MNNADEPAFPSHYDKDEICYDGLTKRQYYAARAMQGILARSIAADAKQTQCASDVTGLNHNFGMKRTHYPIPDFNGHGDKIESYGEFVAREALAFADIMILAEATLASKTKTTGGE